MQGEDHRSRKAQLWEVVLCSSRLCTRICGLHVHDVGAGWGQVTLCSIDIGVFWNVGGICSSRLCSIRDAARWRVKHVTLCSVDIGVFWNVGGICSSQLCIIRDAGRWNAL